MELVNISQESPPSTPTLLFPSRTRKYVRLTGQQAYESLNNLLNEASGSKKLQSSQKETLTTKTRLNGVLGATVTVRVLSEGDVSSVDLVFSYKRAIYAALAVIVTIILLGLLILQNIYAILGLVLIVPLVFNANSSAANFLEMVNKTLPLIEKEYAQKALMADRERWKAQPMNTDALYKRLSEKHVKTWGNTKVLEYKVAEYQKLGLTRIEAIRKAAEEEGIS